MSDSNFHPGEYLRDELDARGWTTADCAARMGGDPVIDELACDMLIACASAPEGHAAQSVTFGEDFARGLETALGTSYETWLNLDRVYHERRKAEIARASRN